MLLASFVSVISWILPFQKLFFKVSYSILMALATTALGSLSEFNLSSSCFHAAKPSSKLPLLTVVLQTWFHFVKAMFQEDLLILNSKSGMTTTDCLLKIESVYVLVLHRIHVINISIVKLYSLRPGTTHTNKIQKLYESNKFTSAY